MIEHLFFNGLHMRERIRDVMLAIQCRHCLINLVALYIVSKSASVAVNCTPDPDEVSDSDEVRIWTSPAQRVGTNYMYLKLHVFENRVVIMGRWILF